MAMDGAIRKIAWARCLGALLGAAVLCGYGEAQAADPGAGWELERDVADPSYAIVDPTSTNMNIDAIVLACEQGASRTGLQLQILLSTASPLLPDGATAEELKPDPAAAVVVDGKLFAVQIYFGDDYAVLADGLDGRVPLLSTPLLDALQAGLTLVLRFDVVAEPGGAPRVMDGQAVVDLQAGVGGRAVAAVRRCALPARGTHAAGVPSDGQG